MGVETCAVMEHALDLPALRSLPTRLAQETGQLWSWDEGEPSWDERGLIDLWFESERLLLRGPEGLLWVGPRAVCFDLNQRLHYGDVEKHVIVACAKLIADVGRACGASQAVVVRDNGHDLSDAYHAAFDGWSFAEILELLQRDHASTPELAHMVEEREDAIYTVAYGHLVWNDAPPTSPPLTVRAVTGTALPEAPLEGFQHDEMSYRRWERRMRLGSSFPWPTDRLLLFGVADFRSLSAESGSRDYAGTDWLESFHRANPRANPALRCYRFSGLEVLAMSHLLEVPERTDAS